jgi:hypothetical protein
MPRPQRTQAQRDIELHSGNQFSDGSKCMSVCVSDGRRKKMQEKKISQSEKDRFTVGKVMKRRTALHVKAIASLTYDWLMLHQHHHLLITS